MTHREKRLLFSKYWVILSFCTSRSDVLISLQMLLSRVPWGLPADSYAPLQTMLSLATLATSGARIRTNLVPGTPSTY